MLKAVLRVAVLVMILSMVSVTDCKKPPEDNIINDRTKLPEENSDLLSVLPEGDTLLLVYTPGATKPALNAGDIVVGQAGEGYLKRIVSTSIRGDTLVLATEQASLTDAIEKCAIDTTLALGAVSAEMQSVRAETTYVGGDGKEYRMVIQSRGPTVRPSLDGKQFEVRLPNVKIEISNASGLAAYVACDTIVLQKGLDVDLGLKIHGAEVTEFRAIGRSSEAVRFKGVKLGFVQSILSAEMQLKLATVPLGNVVVWIPTFPPVPIVFLFELGVYVGLGADLSIDVSGEIRNDASVSCTTSVGARYENHSWQGVYERSINGSADFSFLPVNITAEMQGFLKGSLDTKIYGVAGPSLYLKPYLYDEVTVPPIRLEVGGGIAAGLGFKVEVLSKKLAEFDWTFVDYRWAIAETTFDTPGGSGWTKTFGGSGDDLGASVRQTSDGGYVIAGCTDFFGANGADVYLVKTDASGDSLWTRTFGDSGDDYGYSVQQTSDGGYVIAGCTYTGHDTDAYLIRTDAEGDSLWTRTFGDSGDDYGYSVQQTSDGGYVIAGYTHTGYDYDVYLIRTDAEGQTLWTRTFGGSYDDYGYSVQQTSDGGYVIAGCTGAGGTDVYLIKTDAAGDSLWARTFGGNYEDCGNSVQQTSDGGYVIAGAGGGELYLIKTDAAGDSLWTKTFGGSCDTGSSVQQTSDGGYVITGAGGEDVFLIKTNAAGDSLWTRTFGGNYDDYGCSVQQTSDGGYVIAGCTNTGHDYDVYLIKTDASGNTDGLPVRPSPGASLRWPTHSPHPPIRQRRGVTKW